MNDVMLDRERACLLVIDVQDILLRQVKDRVAESMIKRLKLILSVFKKLGLPVLWTEQYAKGLGPTNSELAELMAEIATPVDKLAFSCMRVEEFRDRLA
ncbi:isochorismatase family protein, partial [bacterium]|nr:isochorismatase family protein [candidate division CSSED10-310 bacterium]